jgi:prevent-host-death family protein
MKVKVELQEVQDETDELLDRVEQGEVFLITWRGRPVAELIPHQPEAG